MDKLEKLKQLRLETNLSLSDCQKALSKANFNLSDALLILQEKSGQKRLNKNTKFGIFGTYSHNGGKMLGIVELQAETDFVAKNTLFKELANDLAAQILFSGQIEYISDDQIAEEKKEDYSEEELDNIVFLRQKFYKNNLITIKDLLAYNSSKFGENLQISKFFKFKTD